MLKRLRERSTGLVVALGLLLAAVGAPHSTDPGHDGGHLVVPVAHDETDHRLRPASPNTDSHQPHCMICHWVRSFRPRDDARTDAAPVHRTGDRVHLPLVAVSAAAPVAQPPLRSPPASPVSV